MLVSQSLSVRLAAKVTKSRLMDEAEFCLTGAEQLNQRGRLQPGVQGSTGRPFGGSGGLSPPEAEEFYQFYT